MKALLLCGCFYALTIAPACAQSTLPEAPSPQPDAPVVMVAYLQDTTPPGSKPDSAAPGNPQQPATETQPEAPATPHQPPPVASPAICAGSQTISSSKQRGSVTVPCASYVDLFKPFLSTSGAHPLTVRQKLKLATKDVIDPFNFITIAGDSGIAVGSNSHSVYGPGVSGFAKDAGVSLTQNMTGEFVGTFLIPSLAHQDPHYYRMPQASVPRRIGHAIIQIFITQGDNGHPMFNYANFFGSIGEDEISNLYVPGRHTNAKATAARVAIGLATAPIGNFITEFVPDVASHINLKVVFVQRIINRVALEEGGSPTQ
ncbi:MAG: hypothetical protein ACYC46_08045 [Acidobacteriaceae bacterium]